MYRFSNDQMCKLSYHGRRYVTACLFSPPYLLCWSFYASFFIWKFSSGHLSKLDIEIQDSILDVKMAVNYMTSSSISKYLPPNKISIQKSLYTNSHVQFVHNSEKRKKNLSILSRRKRSNIQQ